MNAVFKTAADQGVDAAAEMLINNPMVAVTSKLPSSEALLEQMIHENSSTLRMRYWPIEKMDPPASKRLTEIKVPTLIILGEKDAKPVNEVGNLFAAEIQGARKEIIPGADHLPQMVDHKKFHAILSDFLKTVKK